MTSEHSTPTPASLQKLARAIENFADGRDDAPLPTSSLSEMAYLTTLFHQLRERVTARGEELEDAERWYRRIVETAQEGIGTVDAANRVTFVNGSLAAMLGYQAEEMLGQFLFAFVDEEGRHIADAEIPLLQQGATNHLEVTLLRKDGAAVWTLITTNPVFSAWTRILGNPMPAIAAIDRVVHHEVILELDEPGQALVVAGPV